MKSLKIAIIGIKGIPAKWGGHEIYAEEVGKRLVHRGHDVTAFCYSNYNTDYEEEEYEGIKIRRVFAGPYRPVESLVGGLSSSLRLFGQGFDVAHFHGYGSFHYIPLIKRLGIKTLITAHMYDSAWNNPKWGNTARFVIKKGFEIGVKNADFVSTVAIYIQQIIKKQYSVSSQVIYSGMDSPRKSPPNIISREYGLSGLDYILFIGRLDKIKQVDWLIKTYMMLKDCGMKLVIAGGIADKTGYDEELHNLAGNNKNIIFTGFVQGDVKDELLANASFMVSPSMNEGLPIAVIESANYGRTCLVSDIPGHREVVSHEYKDLLFFDKENFQEFFEKLRIMSMTSQEKLDAIGRILYSSVNKKFNWDNAADRVEAAYLKLMNHPNPH